MPRRVLIVFAILLLAATSLNACGQKGPLFLPTETDRSASR